MRLIPKARAVLFVAFCASIVTGAPRALRPNTTVVALPYTTVLDQDRDRLAAVGGVHFVLFDTAADPPAKLFELPVGLELSSVDLHPYLPEAYVADSLGDYVAVVDLNTHLVSSTIPTGVEPRGIVLSPNATRLYVAEAGSNTLSVIDTNTKARVTTVDLSPICRSPEAIALTNDGDADDTDETIFVTCFFSSLRAGKTSLQEGQDDQREGRVVAISAATNSLLPSPNPIILAPVLNTGFNSNGRLAPALGTTPNVAPANPPQFTTPTGAFPNQLAGIAISPLNGLAYVVSTAASPNGPLRYDSNVHGLLSVFDTTTRAEVTAGQTDLNVRRMAPLNLNQGVELATAPSPRLFHSNPVAIAFSPGGSDGWVAVQNTDVVVRVTFDASGIPTIGAPLTAGPGAITRVDLQNVTAGQTPGLAPAGLAVNAAGTRLYVLNRVSESLTSVDITNPSTPSITGTVDLTPRPEPGSNEERIQNGERLFFTGRDRMSKEGWGSCASCHPNGWSDNVTWMFSSGPRQTTSLAGVYAGGQQRILNWSAIFDEVSDFEENIRNVSGGEGLIKDDRYVFTFNAGGTISAMDKSSGAILTGNPLAGGAPLPALPDDRREYGSTALPDGRVFLIGGRTGAGQGTLVPASNAVLEFNPLTNSITPRSSIGFVGRHSLGCVAVRTSGGDRIYAIGGWTTTLNSGKPTSLVQEYNPATDTWRSVADLQTGVAQFAVTFCGGLNSNEPTQDLQVVFGNAGSEAAPVVHPAIQAYQTDPNGPGFWFPLTSGTSGLIPRRNHGIASLVRGTQTRLFIIGGRDSAGMVLDSVQEYLSFGSFVTSVHTPLPIPLERFAVTRSRSDNEIFVAGGVDPGGMTQSGVWSLSINENGMVAGPAGTPSGVWRLRFSLPAPSSNGAAFAGTHLVPFVPTASSGRSREWEDIDLYLRSIRARSGPFLASDPLAMAGAVDFQQTGLTPEGVSCASCHGGPKWSNSRVDFSPPPSPQTGLGLGNERITGSELRVTASQANVLNNVGTFSTTGRVNEVRSSPTDVSQTMAALGVSGFNIPSLLDVAHTAPYFHGGLAESLSQVLDGSLDGVFGFEHHFVTDPVKRTELIAFLQSIDGEVAPPTVTIHPANQSVCPETNVEFSAEAAGSPVPLAQWQISLDGGSTFLIMPGETTSRLRFRADPSQSGWKFRVRFTNRAGSVFTNAGTLTVGGTDSAPVVTVNPVDRIAPEGRSVTFTAGATGTPSPNVNWQFGTPTMSGTVFSDVPGANSVTLTVVSTRSANGQRYRAVFTNPCGGTSTAAARLTVRSFTDPVLVAAQTKVKAIHPHELRVWIDELRVLFGLPSYNWTNVPMTPGATIRAADVTEMQQALREAYAAAGRPAPEFANSATAGGVVVKAAVEELRTLVMDLQP